MYCEELSPEGNDILIPSRQDPQQVPEPEHTRTTWKRDSRMLKNDLHRMVSGLVKSYSRACVTGGFFCQQGACLPQAKPWSIL